MGERSEGGMTMRDRGYGIFSSKADWWIHVSPFEFCAFAYLRVEMVDRLDGATAWAFPERVKLREIASAKGYTVRKDEPFICRHDLPRALFAGFDWQGAGSDALIGDRAEFVIQHWMNNHGRFPPTRLARRALDRSDQFAGIDFFVEPVARHTVEVKCDTLAADTGNLFIQTDERHHQWQQRNGHRHAQEAAR